MPHMNVDDFLYLETKHGKAIIQLFPEIAPQHVAQIKALVNQKFYDGLVFHRVIDGFMVQGGCPKGDGTGGLEQTLPSEFSDIKHERGICSMARSSEPDSASCQFFICLADTPSLDGQYSVWGKVIEGLDFIDAIKKGDPANNGTVTDPDAIISIKNVANIPVKYKQK